MMRLRFFPTVCTRVEDGTDWTPAVNPNYSTYMDALDALRRGGPRYYFRGIRRLCWGVWIETGETWTFHDPGLFTTDPTSRRRILRWLTRS